MGKSWLLVALLVCSNITTLFAQQDSLRGNEWAMGIRRQKVSFVGDTALSEAIPVGFTNPFYFLYSAVSCACDTSGHLALVTDGFSACNKFGDSILNGGSVLNNSCMTLEYGNKCFGANRTLVLPKSATEYYVFYCAYSDKYCYQFFDSAIADTFMLDELRYSVIDMGAAQGVGTVTTHNKLLIGSYDFPRLNASNLTATRHANGRDWWLIKPSGQNRELKFKFLVSPHGISGPFVQEIKHQLVPLFSNDNFGQSTFSADGSLYAECSFGSSFTIYDFDRCTGELALKRIIEPSRLRKHLHYANEPEWLGACFSPNGKYLYMCDFHHVYQLDLAEPNDTLAFMDISQEDTIYFPEYSSMQLTPTGQIWLGCWAGASPFINAIMRPNEKGLACTFKFNYATLLSNTLEPPNLPNYKLGALAGSACDSLTPKDTIKPWGLYPNPASNNVYISLPATAQDIAAGQQAQVFIYASNGTLVHKQLMSVPANKILNLSVNHLAKALYFVQVVYKGERKIWKVVVG
jgi:hypothetical protein